MDRCNISKSSPAFRGLGNFCGFSHAIQLSLTGGAGYMVSYVQPTGYVPAFLPSSVEGVAVMQMPIGNDVGPSEAAAASESMEKLPVWFSPNVTTDANV